MNDYIIIFDEEPNYCLILYLFPKSSFFLFRYCDFKISAFNDAISRFGSRYARQVQFRLVLVMLISWIIKINNWCQVTLIFFHFNKFVIFFDFGSFWQTWFTIGIGFGNMSMLGVTLVRNLIYFDFVILIYSIVIFTIYLVIWFCVFH